MNTAGLAPAEILRVWELGLQRHPVDRALAILAAHTGGPAAPGDLADLPVGAVDAALLDLREATFGPVLELTSSCPQCGTAVELRLQAGDLRVASSDGGPAPDLEADGYRLRLRPLTSRDLAAAAACGTVAEARMLLLQRAVAGADRGGAAVAPSELPDSVVERIPGWLAQADPQADVTLALACPECAHWWIDPWDVAGYFWAELAASARALLRDVDALARAYGWSEPEILSLTPQRLAEYLQMAGQA